MSIHSSFLSGVLAAAGLASLALAQPPMSPLPNGNEDGGPKLRSSVHNGSAHATASSQAWSSPNFRQAIDPVSGAIDIEALRAATMSSLSNLRPDRHLQPDGHREDAMPLPLVRLGLRCIDIPAVLQSADPSLDGCGLIVQQVRPDSPANKAGIRVGMVIVRVEGQPATVDTVSDAIAELEDVGSIELQVLTSDGLVKTTLPMQGVATSWGSTTESIESLSVSNQNGLIRIDAQWGNQQVELRGNRAEIDEQIDRLPAPLGRQLRSRIGY